MTEGKRIKHQLAEGRLRPSIKTNIQHARHVKEIVASKEASQSSGAKLCPKCGSAMVLRTSKKGPNAGNQFWGCSAFPKCHAIATAES